MTRVLRHYLTTAPRDIPLPPDATLVAADSTLCIPGTIDVWVLTPDATPTTRTFRYVRTGDTIPDNWVHRLTTPRSAQTGLVFHVIEQITPDPTTDPETEPDA